jgi:hypothetical protein
MLIFSVCLFYTNTNIADQLHQRSSAAPKIILMRTFLLTALIGLLPVFACTPVSQDSSNETTAEIPPFDLDTLQKMNFNYFWDLADTATYQVLDRYPKLTFSSIAATGFGLTSYIVGAHNGYVSREAAAERVLKTLQVLKALPQGDAESGVSGYKGFYYHFLTLDKATRFKNVELSTIDTGLLMAGVLSVMSYFDRENETEKSIREIADFLYRRVEWDWALNEEGRLSMGWRPERGYIKSDWRGYNEAMVLLIMAIGSPTHSIPAEAWEKWCSTYEWGEFYGQEHVNFDPLFGHQYSHMYIDFRGIQDAYMQEKGIDYFENSRRATISNRAYCIDNPNNFNGYGENCWGLTACDGPANEERLFKGDSIRFRTYSARGASIRRISDDGTIAPTAAGGSVPFAPEICIPALAYFWNTYHEDLVGAYGFHDAFNLSYTWGAGNEDGWFDTHYIGIDQGPFVIQIENHKSELIWDLMKKNPYIVQGLQKAGFTGGWLEGI